jgi:hypothetical protein
LVALGTSSANAAFLVAEGTTAQLYSSSGTSLGAFATGFGSAIGVAEGGGYIFISDYSAGVNKYSSLGTPLGVVNSSSGPFNHGPAGIAFSGGRIDTAGFNANVVMSSGPDFPSPGPQGSEDGNPATPISYLYYASPAGPHGMTSATPNGFSGVYYTTWNTGDSSGTLSYWDPGVSALDSIISFAPGTTPRGVVADGAGSLYGALYSTGEIWKRDGAGTVTTWKTGLNSPVGVAIDGGNLYVSSFTDQSITGYSLADGSQQSTFSTLGAPQYFIVTPIPEPGTIGLMAIAGLVVFFARRKRFKSAAQRIQQT